MGIDLHGHLRWPHGPQRVQGAARDSSMATWDTFGTDIYIRICDDHTGCNVYRGPHGPHYV